MSSSPYWDRYWRLRANRRRFLGGALATSAGAAGLALVGCGDDEEAATPTAAATATPTAAGTAPAASPTPADPFANAKRGGILHAASTGDPPTLDPYGNLSFLTKGFAAYVYSRLFMFETGPGIAYGANRPVPDLAESAEPNEDGTEWVIKLKPNAKFHDVAPVNGRQVTAEDVRFSWGRMTAETTPNRTQVAFVDRMEVLDQQTVKFVLKEPNAAFLDILADANLLWIMPTESDGGFDPAQTAIGSGPWIFKQYVPSQSFTFEANPSWHFEGFPLLAGVELAIIPEYANRLAQFLAGNLEVVDINPNDLVQARDQVEGLQLIGIVPQLLSFIYFDSKPDSPWRDRRFRQAVSMALDRDALTDIGYNVKALRDAGFDVGSPWNNIIPAGFTRWWLDPKSPDMGEGAKYFEYNVEEAKKLLEASGYDGRPIKYQYTANRYGKTFNDIAEATQAYLTAIGLNVQTEVQDYSSVYITQTFVGNFEGIAFGYETPFPEAGAYLIRFFTDDPLNHGKVNDERLREIALQQQRTLDEEERRELFHEAQRINGVEMYYVPNQAGAGTTWTGIQPYVKNAIEYALYNSPGYGDPTETLPFVWLDV